MRRSGSWQSVWDDRILEWLRENEGSGTPSQIHKSDLLDVGRSQISRRLKKLAEHDLVTHIGNGAYVITEKGEGYLDEEFDARTGMWIDQMSGEEEPDGPSPTEAGNGGNGAL